MIVHLSDELLELIAGEQAIAVGVSLTESLVDLLLELNALLLAITHLGSVFLTGLFLLLGEGRLPCGLICNQRREKSIETLLLSLLLLSGASCFDHLTFKNILLTKKS